MQLRKTGTRKVENSTISLFIETEITQLNNMADWLSKPEGWKYRDDFDDTADRIHIRIQALRDTDIFYDDELEKLMEAYSNYLRARKEAREAATSKAIHKNTLTF